jgi:FKBP-type peptidyl-prolyl cis-trans isomerase SlyD
MSDIIQANSVVVIDYTLRDADGEVIDTSEGGEPLYYLHGHENIVPGLENALTGKRPGDALDVVVPPEQGYGEHDPGRTLRVPREELPEDLEIEVGVMLGMQTPDGQSLPVMIVDADAESVVLDANHELAGETLYFSVTVRSVRLATEEELHHGHVHGPGGAHD